MEENYETYLVYRTVLHDVSNIIEAAKIELVYAKFSIILRVVNGFATSTCFWPRSTFCFFKCLLACFVAFP
jgi:hypothetical protein